MLRRLGIAISALGLLAALAGPAAAAPMNWQGTFSATVGALGPISKLGGGVATVNSSAGPTPAHLQTLRLKGSRGGIAAQETVLLSDPATEANGIAAVVVEATVGTGTFAPLSGGAGSLQGLTKHIFPVRGQARVCLVTTDCADFLLLPLTQATSFDGSPGGIVGIGVGGLITLGGDSPIRISLQAAPWTIQTATALDQTATSGSSAVVLTPLSGRGFAHDPASGTTSTAQPSGVVQLVTPVQVVSNLPAGTAQAIGVIATLRVRFVPEPAALLLLGCGVAALAFAGRRRMRR